MSQAPDDRPGEPLTGLGAVTLFSDDLEASRAFYADVLGLRCVFEDDTSAVFDLGTTVVNLLRTAAADELVAPVAVGGAGTPPRAQLTIWVRDVDATSAALVARGLRLLNGPLDRSWGQRTVAFADPSGHVWELAQHLTDA